MTISSTNNRSGPYSGNGATTLFAWGTFQVNDPDHLKVYQTANGATTELTSGFTKSGIPGTFGNVQFDVAPANGVQIMLAREVPNLQESDYTNQGRVQPETVEDDLDLLTMQVQDVSARVDRAIVLDVSSDGVPEITPSASKVFGFDSNGAFTQYPLEEIGGTAFIELGDNVQEIADIAERGAFEPDDYVLGAGTAWRKVRAKNLAGYAYTIEMFGAVGDGNSPDEDTAAFLAFQQIALANPNNVDATLILKPGAHYTYTNNKWVQAFRSLKIIANGAKIECVADVSNSTFSIDRNVFNHQNWNSELGTSNRVGNDQQFQGYMIDAAARGQNTVTTSIAANAGEMAAGDIVLIYGFANQDGGAPVDARYFEYREVESVNASTGEVVLTENLSFDYNPSWPVLYTFQWTSDSAGPPRILPLARANRYLTRRFEVQDAVFIRNRNVPTTSRLANVGALEFCYRNCDMRDLVETTVGSCDLFHAVDCKFSHIELDKITNHVAFERCAIDLLNQGVGTLVVNARGGRIKKQIEVGARYHRYTTVIFDNVNDDGGTSHVMQPNYTNPRRVESLMVDDCPQLGNDLPLIANGQIFDSREFTITGDELIFDKSDWLRIDHIYKGMTLSTPDRSAECVVDDVIEHSATQVQILVTWRTAAPASPITLTAALIGNLEGRGRSRTPVQKRGRYIYFDLDYTDPEYALPTAFQLSGPMIPLTFSVNQLATSGYSVRLRNGTASTNAVQVDGSVAQAREFRQQGALGAAVGSDTHNSTGWVPGEFTVSLTGSDTVPPDVLLAGEFWTPCN